jgi:hypothetical protein
MNDPKIGRWSPYFKTQPFKIKPFGKGIDESNWIVSRNQ